MSTQPLGNVSDFHRSNVHPSQTASLGTCNSCRVILSHEAAHPSSFNLGGLIFAPEPLQTGECIEMQPKRTLAAREVSIEV
jgi:hypothetical protein